MCTNHLTKRLVHQCVFLTLMCEPMPCLGAHGLGLLLASQLSSNEPWHCAPILCVGILVRVNYRLEPLDHGIVPMVSSTGSLHKA